jgi:hypothetical protein
MSTRERSSRAWSSGFYTDEQMVKLSETYRAFTIGGNTQEALNLELAMALHTPFEEIELPGLMTVAAIEKRRTIRPETGIDAALVEQPRPTGPGSSQKAWVEFASLVTEIEEDVLESLSRDEIIDVLVDRDVIDDPRSEKS